MKRAALAVVMAMAAAACSVDRRTDGLECNNTSDCDNGRRCVDDYCVVVPIDAGIGPDADPMCPPPCTSCSGSPIRDLCTIDCIAINSCGGQVNCPAGMACVVNCTGTNSCNNGVDCGPATQCTVNCTGTNACDDTVECRAARCNVTCNGTNACDQGVACNNSCACDVSCSPGACNDPTQCTAQACEVGADNCSSTADPACDTCP